MVVSARIRAATTTFPASPLAPVFRSASRYHYRFSSAAMIRSAFASSVPARSSPFSAQRLPRRTEALVA